MKTLVSLLGIALCVIGITAAEKTGTVKFTGQEVSVMLGVWTNLTGKSLVLEIDPKKVHEKIDLVTVGQFTANEIAGLLTKALREQAGVIITPIDDKRAKVTLDRKAMTKAMPKDIKRPAPGL